MLVRLRHSILGNGSAPSGHRSTVNLVRLPAELLLHIGNEVLRHPETTFGQFKQLRLVCKFFDQVFAPIVLSSILVFHDDYSTTANCEMLLSLISGSGYASYAKKLVLNSSQWDSRETVMPSDDGEDSADQEAFRSSCVPLKKWLYQTIAVPKNAGRRPREPTIELKAKEYIEHIDQVSFNLPNVQTVTWSIGKRPCHNSEKSMGINLRLLETLPSLLQLNLFLCSFYRMDLLAPSLSRIRNLQKLNVCMDGGQEGLSLVWLKDVIARCPDLAHLAIRCISPSGSILLSELFEDVPPDRPLRLQHLRVCGYCYDMTPRVLSHLRSLTSLHVSTSLAWPPLSKPIHEIWQILIDERIFVSKLTTTSYSKGMLRYISHLDNLTHFSIHTFISGSCAQKMAQSLFEELAKHSSTLTHLELSPLNWNNWQCNTLAKLSFLQCNRLEQLTLAADAGISWDEIVSSFPIKITLFNHNT
ncbi:hypothetical protein APHAL10511_002375 [Amanita phalloides]|nr:hypothetical protein APHAL10511_002375 [Amanita phalloides]